MTGQFHLRSEWLAVTQRPQSYWLKSVLKRKVKRRKLTAMLRILTGVVTGRKSPCLTIAELIYMFHNNIIQGH